MGVAARTIPPRHGLATTKHMRLAPADSSPTESIPEIAYRLYSANACWRF